MNNCPACGSDHATILGSLGSRDVFRCRDCGWDWTGASEEEEEEEEEAEWDGQPDELQEWHDFDPDC